MFYEEIGYSPRNVLSNIGAVVLGVVAVKAAYEKGRNDIIDKIYRKGGYIVLPDDEQKQKW